MSAPPPSAIPSARALPARVAWHLDAMPMSVTEWVRLEELEKVVADLRARLQAAEDHLAGLPRREPPAVHGARRFLESVLAGGPLPVDQVMQRAAGAGVPIRSLRRAKARLGVRSERVPQGSGTRYLTRWALP